MFIQGIGSIFEQELHKENVYTLHFNTSTTYSVLLFHEINVWSGLQIAALKTSCL
jgi:hypothetical protein